MHTALQQSMPSILFCIQGMWSHFADDNEHYPKFPNGVQLFSTKFKSYLDFYLTFLNLAPSWPPHLAPFNLCFYLNHFVRHENSFLQAHIYLTSWIFFVQNWSAFYANSSFVIKNSTTYDDQHPAKCSEVPRPPQELGFGVDVPNSIRWKFDYKLFSWNCF